MRRPPVVLSIVAVLVSGVGVGWAASADHESPSLTATVESAPRVDHATEPELSSDSLAAPAAPSATPASEPAPAAVDVEQAVVEKPVPERHVGATDDPAHLEVESRPAIVTPVEVTATTVPPPPPTTQERQPSVAFSAHQAYGSCDEPVPYDIFSGSAEPGSPVDISSPYGSGTAVADGSGHWERKVEFPSAPRGQQFSVSVSGVGGSSTFAFVATASH